MEFARQMSVIGFDIKEERVELMRQGIDPSNELEAEAFEGCDIIYTSNSADLKEANFHVVAVPTPINNHNLPDLTPLLSASSIMFCVPETLISKYSFLSFNHHLDTLAK